MTSQLAKAVRQQFEMIDDVDCLVIEGDDGSKMAVPLAAFSRMNAEVMRRVRATSYSDQERNVGDYLRAKLGPAGSFYVASMPTEKGDVIALLVDRETEREIGFAIQPEAPAVNVATSTHPALLPVAYYALGALALSLVLHLVASLTLGRLGR